MAKTRLMCGILGIISSGKNVVPLVLEGLNFLQYRGYDSAGSIFLNNDGFTCNKVIGAVQNLIKEVEENKLYAKMGMGHTRWATHGKVTIENAHPHYDSGIAVIHNGIVENAIELREELIKNGFTFKTETDTEVILRLLIKENATYHGIELLQRVMKHIRGSFAVVVLFQDNPDELFAIKRGISLLIGRDSDISIVASDLSIISSLSSEQFSMEDDDIAILSSSEIKIFNAGTAVTRKAFKSHFYDSARVPQHSTGKNFMLSEMLQQPALIEKIFKSFSQQENQLGSYLKNRKNINIIACGSSFFAGCIAKTWIEKYLAIRVNVEIASEFVWRDFMKDDAFIFVSQSGETADTLTALKAVRNASNTSQVMALVNVPESAIARLSDLCIYTNAGPELSVAATKSFTCQLASFLSIMAVESKHKEDIFKNLANIKEDLQDVLAALETTLDTIVEKIYNDDRIFYVGKGIGYFVALEGALKLKEVSYIMAEGVQSGELKHGPIALIEEGFPVIVLAPSSMYFEKVLSCIQEIHTRGGKLFVFTDLHGAERLKHLCVDIVILPYTSDLTMPFIYTVAMQMLTYKVAVKNKKSVDYPRNLAKSITVE